MSLLFAPFRLYSSGRYYLTHPWEVAVDAYRDVRHGLRNLARWADCVWYLRDWDGAYLLDVMVRQLRTMEEGTARWHVARADRSRREMRVARCYLQRLRDDRYDAITEVFGRAFSRESVRLRDAQAKHDREYAWRYVARHVDTWWD